MSADNWDVCPRCRLKPNPYHEKPSFSLREDYDIGMTKDGLFYVYYKGCCSDCGFAHIFSHETQVNP